MRPPAATPAGAPGMAAGTVPPALHRRGLGSVVGRVLRRLSSPMVSWGRLHFFSADPFAVPSGRARHEVREATLEEVLAGKVDGSRGDPLPGRLARGDRCVVALAGEEVAGSCWWTRAHAPVPELGREICLGPDEAYVYDARVPSKWQRTGVLGSLVEVLAEEMRRGGVRCAYFYVRGDNVVGHRKAAAWARPAGALTYVRARVGGAAMMIGDLAPSAGGRRRIPLRSGFAASTGPPWRRRTGASDNWKDASPEDAGVGSGTAVEPAP